MRDVLTPEEAYPQRLIEDCIRSTSATMSSVPPILEALMVTAFDGSYERGVEGRFGVYGASVGSSGARRMARYCPRRIHGWSGGRALAVDIPASSHDDES